MACGCAIIGSDTPPVREFLEDGKTGVMVPFPDSKALSAAVLRVLDGGPEVKKMRAAARQFAEANLRMDTYLEKFEALIGDVIARHAASRAPEPVPAPRRAARTKRG